MGGSAMHLSARVKLHDLDRLATFDRAVVQRDRGHARKHGDRLEMQVRVKGQRALEVVAQGGEAAQHAIVSPGAGREWGHEQHVVAVVRSDPIEVVGIPCRDPFAGKTGQLRRRKRLMCDKVDSSVQSSLLMDHLSIASSTDVD